MNMHIYLDNWIHLHSNLDDKHMNMTLEYWCNFPVDDRYQCRGRIRWYLKQNNRISLTITLEMLSDLCPQQTTTCKLQASTCVLKYVLHVSDSKVDYPGLSFYLIITPASNIKLLISISELKFPVLRLAVSRKRQSWNE